MKLLLDRGANIDHLKLFDDKLLHNYIRIVRHEYMQNNLADDEYMIKFLIDNGYDINKKDIHGYTPLSIAVFIYDKKKAEILLRLGANPNICDNYGNTPLHLISLYVSEISNLLIKKGAYVDYQNNNGNTPLHRALESSNINLIRLLLSNGARLNIKNNEGITPLKHNSNTFWIMALLESRVRIIPLVGLCIRCIREHNIDTLWLPPVLFKFPDVWT